MSKWLTMRELIQAEERLMFARHNLPREPRKDTLDTRFRQPETECSSFRFRPTFRKELY